MAAEETVAFSLKDVYLVMLGCMSAFILQQHLLSQENHYCLRKLEKVLQYQDELHLTFCFFLK